MRKTGPKLCGFGVPLALLAAALCGQTELAAWLAVFHLAANLASLAAPDAFSRAAARLLSTKKVMGSLLIALLLTAIGAGALIFADSRLNLFTPSLVAIGAVLTAIRCVEELFLSQGDLTSARLTDALTFIALTAGLLIPGDKPLYCLAGTGATLALSGIIAAGFSRRELPRPNLANLREIPAALLRTALYPALCAGMLVFSPTDWHPTAVVSGFLAGQILTESAKSTFRRDKFESAGLKIGVSVGILLSTAALAALGCIWYDLPLHQIPAMLLLAAAAALLLYGPFDWETIAAAIVSLAAAAAIAIRITPEQCSFPMEIFVGPAAGIILCILMIRQWAQLARQCRANRIRKRAMKRSRS